MPAGDNLAPVHMPGLHIPGYLTISPRYVDGGAARAVATYVKQPRPFASPAHVLFQNACEAFRSCFVDRVRGSCTLILPIRSDDDMIRRMPESFVTYGSDPCDLSCGFSRLPCTH